MTYKVQIDTSKIDIPFTTSTGYTITIEEGFVKEESGNRLKNPAITFTNTVDTFESGPIVVSLLPIYNDTTRSPKIILESSRGVVSVNNTSSANFYLYANGTLTNTISNTSTLISYIDGKIILDLSNIITTSTTYHLQADAGICRDLFFNSLSINNNSNIKFITSSSYITQLPAQTYTYTDIYSEYASTIRTSINENYFAVSNIAEDYIINDTKISTSSVSIYNIDGEFLYKFYNSEDTDLSFGASISLDQKLVIGAPDYDGSSASTGAEPGKIYVYDISNTSSNLVTTITGNFGSGSMIQTKGNYIISRDDSQTTLYDINGNIIKVWETANLRSLQNIQLNDQYQGISDTKYAFFNYYLIGGGSYGASLYVSSLSNPTNILYEIDIGNIGTNFNASILLDNDYLILLKNGVCSIYNPDDGTLITTLDSNITQYFNKAISSNQNYIIFSDNNTANFTDGYKGRLFLYNKSDLTLYKIIDNPLYKNLLIDQSGNLIDEQSGNLSGLYFGVSSISCNSSTILTTSLRDLTYLDQPQNGYVFRYINP